MTSIFFSISYPQNKTDNIKIEEMLVRSN